jgi:hypothetical protein
MRIIKIFQPVLIVLVVHVIFTFFLLKYYQGDISCLVHAGPTFTNSAEAPSELCLKDQGDGYDGQFNYRFALDPFSNQPVLHGISIDKPIYRYQRIFYSFLTWVVTGGNRTMVPVVFVLINLIAACGLTAISAIYALNSGRNSHWSLVLGLYPGFLLSYALDLSHTLEIVLLFSALFLVKKKNIWAVILLTCAILTRETALLLAVAIFITAFIQRWQRWYLYLLPLGVFIVWQTFLLWFWRDVPNLTSGEIITLPLAGFLTAFTVAWNKREYFDLSLLIIVVAFGLVVLLSLRRSPTTIYIRLAWLFYATLTLMMSLDIWAKFNGYLRGLSEWYFLSCLIIFPLIKLPNWRRHLEWPWKAG